jgi:threonine dehydratase
MPTITPDFKVQRTERFGGDNVNIRLVGDNFDEAAEAMKRFARDEKVPIVHPFDDWDVIAGQGTVAIELLAQMQEKQIHYVIIPIGGGGISTGMATWFAIHSPQTQIIAVEPENADAMKKSLEQ